MRCPASSIGGQDYDCEARRALQCRPEQLIPPYPAYCILPRGPPRWLLVAARSPAFMVFLSPSVLFLLTVAVPPSVVPRRVDAQPTHCPPNRGIVHLPSPEIIHRTGLAVSEVRVTSGCCTHYRKVVVCCAAPGSLRIRTLMILGESDSSIVGGRELVQEGISIKLWPVQVTGGQNALAVQMPRVQMPRVQMPRSQSAATLSADPECERNGRPDRRRACGGRYDAPSRPILTFVLGLSTRRGSQKSRAVSPDEDRCDTIPK
ncbi:hypothetical protein G7Y89_g15211 [Cudoniella acicularis]|uniref:Uncharacterized protein n=1 Tax=Cudoniella acicularis TaxID=354080 RepID=A0A8H4VNK0_9HELO|nr:hypothetical protein G7Y89_g15211 [Cudoniella acicularis]